LKFRLRATSATGRGTLGVGDLDQRRAEAAAACRRPFSPPSKVSFQVNGFGGAETVCAEEMDQFGIIPVDQRVYFLNAEFSQVIHKFI
jgi:hypothetical protein